MDCSHPGSSVHGTSQARILQWVVIPFFRGSSQHRDWTHVSCIGRRILYHWATREATIYIYIYVYRYTHIHKGYIHTHIKAFQSFINSSSSSLFSRKLEYSAFDWLPLKTLSALAISICRSIHFYSVCTEKLVHSFMPTQKYKMGN